MPKKFTFNNVEITTAKHNGTLFFNRMQLGEALGYKAGMNYLLAGKYLPLEVGALQFIPFDGLQETLGSVKGERKTLAAGLLQEISEQFSLSLALNKPGTLIADLDETSQLWAKASIELKTARKLLDECETKERALWVQMEKERNNG